MIAFIDDHREAYGVEPICRVLPIAPSSYHAHVAQRIDAGKRSARARRDAELKVEVQRVFAENFGVYGARKVWRQLRREGFAVARCTVERLMANLGLQGVSEASPCGRRSATRRRLARSIMSIANSMRRCRTCSGSPTLPTWPPGPASSMWPSSSTPYAGRIIGWRVSRTAHASFVLDALEQALHERRPPHRGGLVHHSDRGSQYVSIRYTERLAEAGIEPSVRSVGDSYDNALAETINGLYKAEVIHRRGPWRSFEAVEFATLEWVDWFNHRRLLEPIGNMPPVEAEERYYAKLDQPAMAA
jgi:putative transposase